MKRELVIGERDYARSVARSEVSSAPQKDDVLTAEALTVSSSSKPFLRANFLTSSTSFLDMLAGSAAPLPGLLMTCSIFFLFPRAMVGVRVVELYECVGVVVAVVVEMLDEEEVGKMGMM